MKRDRDTEEDWSVWDRPAAGAPPPQRPAWEEAPPPQRLARGEAQTSATASMLVPSISWDAEGYAPTAPRGTDEDPRGYMRPTGPNGVFACNMFRFGGRLCTKNFDSMDNLFAHAYDKPTYEHPQVALALLRERPSVADKKGGLAVCVRGLRERGVVVPNTLDVDGELAQTDVQRRAVALALEAWAKAVLVVAARAGAPLACPLTRDRFPLAGCNCKPGTTFASAAALLEHAAGLKDAGMHDLVVSQVAEALPEVAGTMRWLERPNNARRGGWNQNRSKEQGRDVAEVLRQMGQLEAKQAHELQRQRELNAQSLAHQQELIESFKAQKAKLEESQASVSEFEELLSQQKENDLKIGVAISTMDSWAVNETEIIQSVHRAAVRACRLVKETGKPGDIARSKARARNVLAALPLVRISGKSCINEVKEALEARDRSLPMRERLGDDLALQVTAMDGFLDKLFESGRFRPDDSDRVDVTLAGVAWSSFQMTTLRMYHPPRGGDPVQYILPVIWYPFVTVNADDGTSTRERSRDDPFLSHLSETLGTRFADYVYAMRLDAINYSAGAGTSAPVLWEPSRQDDSQGEDAGDRDALSASWRELALKSGGTVPNTPEVLRRGCPIHLKDFKARHIERLVANLVDRLARDAESDAL